MKPITPKELGFTAGDDIPKIVIEAVNNLLKIKFRLGKSVILSQDDIVEEIIRLDDNCNATTIYNNGWLDFEPVFERAGWKVEYDKPGYNESYPATFKFTPKK